VFYYMKGYYGNTDKRAEYVAKVEKTSR